MRVFSAFDGISCGQLALKRAGITPSVYFASEIDPHAITVTQKNFPGTIQLGSISNICGSNYGKIDLLLGGPPCQDLSCAGKGVGLSGARSGLFWDLLRLKQEMNPTYFLVENVASMSKENKEIITKHLGVEPILINSALVSAQNRKRLYWTNLNGVVQPEDKRVVLSDILEHGLTDRDKAYCIDSNYWKGGNLTSYFDKHRRQLVFEVKDGVACTAERGRRLTVDGVRRDDRNGKIVRGYEVRTDGKTNALTTVQKDNFVTEEFTIRKLTPIECERLQTLGDGYTEGVSNTQRYRAIGNGWTVDVVAHILKGLK